jgi:hypothetical protein
MDDLHGQVSARFGPRRVGGGCRFDVLAPGLPARDAASIVPRGARAGLAAAPMIANNARSPVDGASGNAVDP